MTNHGNFFVVFSHFSLDIFRKVPFIYSLVFLCKLSLEGVEDKVITDFKIPTD